MHRVAQGLQKYIGAKYKLYVLSYSNLSIFPWKTTQIEISQKHEHEHEH